MQCGNYQTNIEERLKKWFQLQSYFIELAIAEGYTREEAIEMLKVYALDGIASKY